MSAWRAGKVQWFNDEDGKGMIVDLEDGRMFYVNYKAIQTNSKWKSLKEDQEIEFDLVEDFSSNYIREVREC